MRELRTGPSQARNARRIPRSHVRLALVYGLVGILWPCPARGLPVFARIYDKPCGTCHTVFPQLNPEGENFRAHGFHALPPVVKPLRVGDVLEVPGTVPVGVYLATGEDVTRTPEDVSPHARFNLQFLSLLAGGELGKHLAFLLDYELLETDPDTGALSVNSLPEQAYLLAHAEPAGWLTNLKMGWFELPLGTSPRVHRLSTEPYLTYSLNGCSLLGRTPRGMNCADEPILSEPQIGAELSTQPHAGDVSFTVGMTNGSNNRLDEVGSKDFYWRIGRQIGLQKIGFFMLYSPDIQGAASKDHTLRFGPDATWYSRRVRIVGQLLMNFESNPTGRSEALWYYGTFVEGDYRFTPRLLGLLRGEYAWSSPFDDTANGRGTQIRRRLWTVTGGGQWTLLENVKLVLEGAYGENDEVVSGVTTTSWSATLRVVTAFWVGSPPFFRAHGPFGNRP